MITEYEIENVYLADSHTKARKISALNEFAEATNDAVAAHAIRKFKEKILGDESENDVMARAEEEDRLHWIEFYGRRAACDLLTLGKVQPETMLAMSSLPVKDFSEVVKLATTRANQLNHMTMATEKELNLDLISDAMI
jgi:hypothetical protein